MISGQWSVNHGDSYATHALAPAAWLIAVPDGVSVEQAAGGMNQGFLAYALAPGGYLVVYGQSSGCVPPFDLSEAAAGSSHHGGWN